MAFSETMLFHAVVPAGASPGLETTVAHAVTPSSQDRGTQATMATAGTVLVTAAGSRGTYLYQRITARGVAGTYLKLSAMRQVAGSRQRITLSKAVVPSTQDHGAEVTMTTAGTSLVLAGGQRGMALDLAGVAVNEATAPTRPSPQTVILT